MTIPPRSLSKRDRIAKVIAEHDGDTFTAHELNDPRGICGRELTRYIQANGLAERIGEIRLRDQGGYVTVFRKKGVGQ